MQDSVSSTALAVSAPKGIVSSPGQVGPLARVEHHPQWPLLARLPLRLKVSVVIPRFCVKDLLALHAGQMVKTAWQSSEDVPLHVGGVQLAWGEFEVVEQRMALRLTRLA